MKHFIALLAFSAVPLVGIAMAQQPGDHHGHSHDHAHTEPAPTTAVAVFTPTKGNDTHGVVTFEKVKGGIKVTGRIENLTPGEHGFHVHQYGDLRKDDATSTGGHFNPTNTVHAGRDAMIRHVGDMGNVTADENGVAEFSFVDDDLAFSGPTSIIGRGLIVHAGKDDLTSQPSGAAGPRVGMAVIGWANPELD
ncbi:MAG: superoxide dismutase family protein [Puniceicoccales bacterium]